MIKFGTHGLSAALAVASAALVAVSLSAPTAATAEARGAQPDAGRTTGMRGPCYGGGRMSVVISQPAGGGLSLRVSTKELREGSRWRGAVQISDLDSVVDDQDARVDWTRAVDGGFTLDFPLDAVARPSATVSLFTPRGEECTSTVDTTSSASATCPDRRLITVSAVQTRSPDVLALVAGLHNAHPGSLWANWSSLRSRPETFGSGGDFEAGGDGVVEARIFVHGIVIPNRAFATTFHRRGVQRCSMQLNTHRLPAT